MLGKIKKFSDFTNFVIRIYIRNDTSETEFLDFSNHTLIELDSEQFTLETPPNIYMPGHNLTVCFQLPGAKKLKKFPDQGSALNLLISGKVVSKELLKGGEVAESVIHLTQFRIDDWSKILGLILDRAKQISNFFRKGNS